jgi:hypothetical protein
MFANKQRMGCNSVAPSWFAVKTFAGQTGEARTQCNLTPPWSCRSQDALGLCKLYYGLHFSLRSPNSPGSNCKARPCITQLAACLHRSTAPWADCQHAGSRSHCKMNSSHALLKLETCLPHLSFLMLWWALVRWIYPYISRYYISFCFVREFSRYASNKLALFA